MNTQRSKKIGFLISAFLIYSGTCYADAREEILGIVELYPRIISEQGQDLQQIVFLKSNGYINEEPETLEYEHLFSINKPVEIFGGKLISMNLEYAEQYLGCCVMPGIDLILEFKEDHKVSELMEYAKKNLCEVQADDDAQAPSGTKIYVLDCTSIKRERKLHEKEMKAREPIDIKDTSAAISTILSEAEEIKTRLIKLNIGSVNVYDPTSNGNLPPKGKHVALIPDLPFDLKIELLKIAFEYKFDSYDYDFDIYRTYGAIFGDYPGDYPINEQLFSIINNNPTPESLEAFEKQIDEIEESPLPEQIENVEEKTLPGQENLILHYLRVLREKIIKFFAS
jgi:hypothetical protein